jgi:concentrative nucleoside transporter, CNT family
MNVEHPEPAQTPSSTLTMLPVVPPTPISWRLIIAAGIALLAGGAYLTQGIIGVRGQAMAGIFFFFGLVAIFSQNLRAVNWKTIGYGVLLQVILAILILKVPQVHASFEAAGNVVKKFIGFSDAGAKFVFGNLADARPEQFGGTWARLFPSDSYAFQFAFVALPPILFVSALFTVLYHFGILQFFVRMFALVMTKLMGTSGAETLSVSANVFMGQTEAPLIVKPYVPRMTNSELFALMVSGFAHISGGLMVVYINYGADPVAVLTTCVMACPCSLYLAKLMMPERFIPETSGTIKMKQEKSPYVNAIDAATAGTSDGLRLALNVAAMLMVFIAFVAMFDAGLGLIQKGLSLQKVFGWIFSPAAFLMGVELRDVEHVGSLLGAKLAINEHVAYLQLKTWKATPEFMTDRSYQLAAFALTGFANFASVGIQLGGIGAMAPDRRSDLARLGMRALFVGFTATLLNAAIAGVLL